MGLRVVRQIPAGHFVVRLPQLSQIEPVQGFPAIPRVGLEQEMIIQVQHAIGLVGGLLRSYTVQAQRRGGGQGAESGVHQIIHLVQGDPQQHMGHRRPRRVGLLPQYSRPQTADLKPQLFEDVLEQQVVLVTITAPFLVNQLALQPPRGQLHLQTEKR